MPKKYLILTLTRMKTSIDFHLAREKEGKKSERERER